jgi:hypothetical protein
MRTTVVLTKMRLTSILALRIQYILTEAATGYLARGGQADYESEFDPTVFHY